MQTETERLVIELPVKQHKAIKARALLKGLSIKDYVLSKILPQKEEDETEDVATGLIESLTELKEYRKGNKELRLAEEVFAEL